jgi:hypothetical protein
MDSVWEGIDGLDADVIVADSRGGRQATDLFDTTTAAQQDESSGAFVFLFNYVPGLQTFFGPIPPVIY